MFHEWKLARMKKRGERYKKEKEVRDAYAEYIPDRKKRRFSSIMVVIVVTAIVMYTVASFWLTYVSGVSIDSTLTTAFYTFFGSELCMLTGIKISKVRKNAIASDDESACG